MDTPTNDNTDPRGPGPNTNDLPANIDPEDPEAALAAYALALQQEYETKTAIAPDNVEEHTKEFFKANIVYASAQIVFLAMHAESETVRLNASKYIHTKALEVESSEKDPVKAIIAQLQRNDKTSPAPLED